MNAERAAARRLALQAMYQVDVQGAEFLDNDLRQFVAESSEDPRVREIAAFMTASAWKFRETADAWLGRLASKWPVYRMPPVDRNILRLAVWEMVNYSQTPAKVVLDEAINMAKEFSTAESGTFINGVLDAVLKEHLAETGKSQ